MPLSRWLLLATVLPLFGQVPKLAATPATVFPPALVEAGKEQFTQACAFCHGRDAAGGEEGPDLTRSKLVTDDVNGNLIGPVVRNGRADHGMPAFNVSQKELDSLTAFIHTQKSFMESQKGGRRGVDVSDLQTGNLAAGKVYFNGTGKCYTCHSSTGDLGGIAKRFEGLKLMERLLYPKGAKATATVTMPSGEIATGTVSYRDEFSIAITEKSGRHRSWFTDLVKVSISDPAQAHVDLLAKYSDDDIHNLMAYLQTLK